MGAANLQAMAPILSRNNVRLVGVGVETLGWREFLDSSGWRETLAIDDTHKVYSDLGTVKHDWSTIAGIFATVPVVLSWARRASKLGYKGNNDGNKSQFGGHFAFDAEGNCVYAHRQDASTFEPDLPKMLRALRLSEADLAEAEKLAYPAHGAAKRCPSAGATQTGTSPHEKSG